MFIFSVIVPLVVVLTILCGNEMFALNRLAPSPAVKSVAATWGKETHVIISALTKESGCASFNTPVFTPLDTEANGGSHQYPHLATILTIIICVAALYIIVTYGDSVMGTSRAIGRDLDD
jgi:hypothetical protein